MMEFKLFPRFGAWRKAGIAVSVLAVFCGGALVLAQAAAAPTVKPPTQMVPYKDCVTSECHANIKSTKVLHGPVNVNACDACHKVTDEKAHRFALLRPKNETCTFCHKMDLAEKSIMHKPVTTGDCLPCHNPHGGSTGKFLRSTSMADLCNQCHKDVVAGKKMVHGPVAAGACEACHQPHAAPYPKLLVAPGKQLCLNCHKEMSDQLKTARVVHKPVAEGECSQCHDPHASDYVKQTKAPTAQLCTSCHEHDAIKQAITDSKYKHSIVTADQACLNCHTAHGGSMAKLMKNEPVKVCLNCHAKEIKVDSTRTVASVAEIADPQQIKHGPIQNGNCSGCHKVHGSDISRLLAKEYPNTFYQPFELEKYDLCFSCHDKQLVLLDKTKGLTGFRDGDRNLHYVHVNIADRGRTCRACHETHASRQPLHIRDSVPYGKWKLPIGFEKTATGGSCSPGCHRPYGYDRENPKAATLPSPTTRPTFKEGTK